MVTRVFVSIVTRASTRRNQVNDIAQDPAILTARAIYQELLHGGRASARPTRLEIALRTRCPSLTIVWPLMTRKTLRETSRIATQVCAWR